MTMQEAGSRQGAALRCPSGSEQVMSAKKLGNVSVGKAGTYHSIYLRLCHI